MDPIERLSKIFERFPGIGPRQANRFVQFLLRSSPALRRELADSLLELGGSVRQCTMCLRFFSGREKMCGICANPQRDHSSLAIVASDADLLALERSGTYRGMYFVLGGTISLVSEKTDMLRLKELERRISEPGSRFDLEELILAFPANPEGDATAARLREELSTLIGPAAKITTLGRGLSTGSELEYADPDTIKSAFDNRR